MDINHILPQGLPRFNIRLDQIAHYEAVAAKRIEALLWEKYPGHPFAATVSFQRFQAVVNHPLMPEDIAIIVNLKDEDIDGAIYVRLAGELLERYRVPRGPLVAWEHLEATPEQHVAALSDIE